MLLESKRLLYLYEVKRYYLTDLLNQGRTSEVFSLLLVRNEICVLSSPRKISETFSLSSLCKLFQLITILLLSENLFNFKKTIYSNVFWFCFERKMEYDVKQFYIHSLIKTLIESLLILRHIYRLWKPKKHFMLAEFAI